MRNEKYLLSFYATKNFTKELKDVVDSLSGYDEDALWRIGADNLVDLIEEKVVEIDSLLAKIHYAIKVEDGELIESEIEIKNAVKEAGENFDKAEQGKAKRKVTV